METHLLANSILNMGFDRKMSIRHVKLQKLMYLSCGWYVGKHNEWIISGDFKAFHYGPTETETYRFFRKYGARPIEKLYMNEKYIINTKTHTAIYDTLNFVFDEYGRMDDFELADLTHDEGGPWWKIYVDKKEVGGLIPRESIRDHYRELVKNIPQ